MFGFLRHGSADCLTRVKLGLVRGELTRAAPGLPYLEEEEDDGQQVREVARQPEDVHPHSETAAGQDPGEYPEEN